jgi:predicted ArsR family transcriptional regulator
VEKTTGPRDVQGLGPRDGTSDAGAVPAGRQRVLGTLRAAGRPRSLAELVKATGLHVNTVRGHLDDLVGAGTVSRRQAPAVGRGRPAWLYDADGPDPGPGTEYAGLAATLAATLERTSPSPRADAVRAGEDWGRSLQAQVSGLPAGREQVVRVLERMGFAPRTGQDGAIRLTRCPLLQTARRHPEVVCGVHQGIVQGVLAAAAGSAGEPELRAFAEPGACVLTIDAVSGDHR